jgi:flagellar FliJ protein
MFIFKLEPLLRHRKRIEEKIQIELADLKTAYGKAQKRLDSLHHAKSRNEEEILNKYKKGKTSLSEIILYVYYINKLKKDIKQQREVVKKLEERIEDKRKELLKASQERKIIEKLKENSENDYIRSILRKERIFLDEIAANQYTRKTLKR